MYFYFFITSHYLFARKKHTFVSFISIVSAVSVAIGVAALIIVLGVMTGLGNNMRDKILGVNAHIVMVPTYGALPDYHQLSREMENITHVLGATPFLYTEVMASFAGRVKGVALRGIDPKSAKKVLMLDSNMVEGNTSVLNDNTKNKIIIGRDLGYILGAHLGDEIMLLTPSAKSTSAGFVPKVVRFEIGGFFDTGVYEFDSTLGYTSIPTLQKMLGAKQDIVSGIELKVDDVYKVAAIAASIKRRIGNKNINVSTWIERNKNLFSALKLEKIAMTIVLGVVVLVASFSIVTTLIMLVMEKTKDIALMMSLGATRRQIRNIFIFQGFLIGVVGTALGYFFGIGISLLLQKYQFIKLPKEVYLLDHLPVELLPSDLLITGGVAMLLCLLATLYPAYKAASMKPVEAMRYE